MRVSTLGACLIATLAAMSCRHDHGAGTADSIRDRKPDTAAAADIIPIADSPGAALDSLPMQHFIRLTVVGHMASNAPTDAKIPISCIAQGVSQADITAALNAITLYDAPTKTPVAFDLEQMGGCGRNIVPKQKLQNDTEYFVEITKTKYVTTNRALSHFHVGSLPRIAKVGIGKQIVGVTVVSILFSEQMTSTTLTADLSDGGKALAFTPALRPPTTAALELTLTTPVATSSTLTLGIDAAAEAATGLKLDGKYAGTAGSGPFSLTFTPDAMTTGVWEPD